VKQRGGRERKRDKMGGERESVKRERLKNYESYKDNSEWKTERKIGRVNERMNENKTKRALTEKGRN
jgi:hypothetical protein